MTYKASSNLKIFYSAVEVLNLLHMSHKPKRRSQRSTAACHSKWYRDYELWPKTVKTVEVGEVPAAGEVPATGAARHGQGGGHLPPPPLEMCKWVFATPVRNF